MFETVFSRLLISVSKNDYDLYIIKNNNRFEVHIIHCLHIEDIILSHLCK